ncbi:MAG: hypothetical protein GXY98_04185 [Erysipelothrix sp.]|nr:hypothetical protein [Erysipelothrix sp.]
MKRNNKHWLITVGLVLLIIIFIYFNYYYFVRSTNISKDKSIDYYISQIKQKNLSKEVIFLNEFIHKDTWYFVKTDDYLEVYNNQIELKKRLIYPGISSELQQRFPNDVIQFGYFENNFVYVVKSNKSERWYSLDNLNELFAISF